mmetsp:Transcript_22611/g.53598  ORF Transcript_22611/g.53598 Transcript_22611/m.53598 type:complete len:284 (+) Transcript_22611:479-1330(+)
MRASRTSLSVASPNGSRHSRSVPAKSTGSCIMIVIPFFLPRTSARHNLAKSNPSNRMRPASISTSRNNAAVRVDLPAPVRPTTPHRWPDWREKDRPFRERGKPGLYRSDTESNSSSPDVGHSFPGLTRFVDVTPTSSASSSSCGNFSMARTRSTEVIAASDSLIAWIMKPKHMVKFDDQMISIAARPGDIWSTSFRQTTKHTENKTAVPPIICTRTRNHVWAARKFIIDALLSSSDDRKSWEKYGPLLKARIVDVPSRTSANCACTGDRHTASSLCKSTADFL